MHEGRQHQRQQARVSQSLPIICLNWYEAFAFCAWDGGRLPTDAEWNYAAAGGSEQRVYPWSVPPTSTTLSPALGVYSPAPLANVGSLSPQGDGKWGQADLSGNVFEYTFDLYDAYVNPCQDCALVQSATASSRVARGGSFHVGSSFQTVSFREPWPPANRTLDLGLRCAYGP